MAAQQGDVEDSSGALSCIWGGQRGNLMTMNDDLGIGHSRHSYWQLDEAAAHFETALTVWNKGRYPEYTWIAFDYADMPLNVGMLRDQERAMLS